MSVVIPTYEMHGVGTQMLERSLEALEQQSFKDFEVVISDNSHDEAIKNLCGMAWQLDIKYFKSEAYGLYANTQQGIEFAKGQLIKVLYQDDYLASDTALMDVVNNFGFMDNWLITAASNNPHPYYSQKNTLGSPSALTFRANCGVRFNGEFNWVGDLDFYRNMHAKFGEPKILRTVGVIMGLGDHQTTNHLTEAQKQDEHSRI